MGRDEAREIVRGLEILIIIEVIVISAEAKGERKYFLIHPSTLCPHSTHSIIAPF